MRQIKLEHVEVLEYARNEAFKSLRTNIKFCGDDVHKLLLTSSTPNEGKSTVSFYLAKALAEDGYQVAFVDADLRKSVMLGRTGAVAEDKEPILGLSHFLTGQAKFDQILCETNLPGLHMIFTGPVPPNPTELLGNEHMTALFQELEKTMDYIIVDAPPLGSVIDGAILARMCDGAILIIENHQISYRLAQSVKKQLEQSGCRILGAILNKIEIKKGGYYQGYYKKYYGKYGKYGREGAYEPYGNVGEGK